jgi:hypothetical protein
LRDAVIPIRVGPDVCCGNTNTMKLSVWIFLPPSCAAMKSLRRRSRSRFS